MSVFSPKEEAAFPQSLDEFPTTFYRIHLKRLDDQIDVLMMIFIRDIHVVRLIQRKHML